MKFSLRGHTTRAAIEAVDVFNDRNQLVAVIYPHPTGLNIVSRHLIGVLDDSNNELPAVFVQLDPSMI